MSHSFPQVLSKSISQRCLLLVLHVARLFSATIFVSGIYSEYLDRRVEYSIRAVRNSDQVSSVVSLSLAFLATSWVFFLKVCIPSLAMFATCCVRSPRFSATLPATPCVQSPRSSVICPACIFALAALSCVQFSKLCVTFLACVLARTAACLASDDL